VCIGRCSLGVIRGVSGAQRPTRAARPAEESGAYPSEQCPSRGPAAGSQRPSAGRRRPSRSLGPADAPDDAEAATADAHGKCAASGAAAFPAPSRPLASHLAAELRGSTRGIVCQMSTERLAEAPSRRPSSWPIDPAGGSLCCAADGCMTPTRIAAAAAEYVAPGVCGCVQRWTSQALCLLARAGGLLHCQALSAMLDATPTSGASPPRFFQWPPSPQPLLIRGQTFHHLSTCGHDHIRTAS